MSQEEEQPRTPRGVSPIFEEDAPTQPGDSLPAMVEDLPSPSSIRVKNRHIKRQYVKSQRPKNSPRSKSIPTINDHAQFWTAHDAVSKEYARNSDLVQDWNKSLDILLAGLFSAINTAFIMESYKDLQPNPAEITNDLLRVLISHRDSNLTHTAEELQPRSRNSSAVHINSIFFSSLSLSLSAAFGAVTKAARKIKGLERWKLQLLIELLPLLLQFSLLLFLIGVVDFLWKLDSIVATLQLSLLCAGLVVYCTTIVIGIRDPSSPFQTPVSRYVPRYYSTMSRSLGFAFKDLTMKHLPRLPYQALGWILCSLGAVDPDHSSEPLLPATNAINPYRKNERSKWDHELVTAAEAVVWLLEQTDHPNVAITALDAVRRLPPSLALYLIQERKGLLERLIAFHHSLIPLASSTDTQADWLKAWPDAAVVSALAWHHILWADFLEHRDRLTMRLRLSESDPYADSNVWEVLETNSDIPLTAKCLLKFSFNKSDSSQVGDLLIQCMNYVRISLLASRHILRIKVTDASRTWIKDDIVTWFSPFQLTLDAAMILLSAPDIWRTSDLQSSLPKHLASLLDADPSDDSICYVAIAIATIRSRTPDYYNWDQHVAYNMPSRARQRRWMVYPERNSEDVMKEVHTHINRLMAARSNALDKGLIVMDHVALACSVVRCGIDEDIRILKILLKMTSDLFEEKYKYPENPIPYPHFPRDLVQLSRFAPNDAEIQILVAKLLCQCQEGDWIRLLDEESGEDIRTLFQYMLESNPQGDHNESDVGQLVERVKDRILYLEPHTRLIALQDYCMERVKNHGSSPSFNASLWISRRMPMNDEGYEDGIDLLQTQISCAMMTLVIGPAEFGVSNEGLVEYLQMLLSEETDLHWPQYMVELGLVEGPGNDARRLMLSVPQLNHVWRGEASLLLWSMAKRARFLNDLPSKWESSLFFNAQVGGLMLEYHKAAEEMKRWKSDIDFRRLRIYLESTLQAWRTDKGAGGERQQQFERTLLELSSSLD
ncbi:hypothetical protein FRC03_007437 [Tulasnella sp. 419]|nr:hypothetical protein FRC03_007437 [Tulasnella sp. 419]